MKVLLFDHLLAHYRRDVYELLAKTKDVDFQFVSGDEYNGVKKVDILNNNDYFFYKYNILNLRGHQFFFSFQIILHYFRNINRSIICTGVDFHLPHTILIFFFHRIILRRDFYWWTHANFGSQGKFGILIRKLFYKNSSGILAYSQAGRSNLLKMNVKPSMIKVVNNSLNKDDYGFLKYDLTKSYGNTINIVYSGRLTKKKRIDILIKAIKLIVSKYSIDVKCTIIGNGEINILKNLAADIGIDDRIDFVGAKYGREVDSYFLKAHIFVYPSGIGLSIVHALSYGLPVITTNNESLHFPEFELLKPGVNGDLFIDCDVEDLAKKIMEWKEKVIYEGEVIKDKCVQSIVDMDYTPEALSKNILDFVIRKVK